MLTNLDMSLGDALVMVVLSAAAAIAGRGLALRLTIPVVGAGTVILAVMFGSVAGAVLAVAVLGLSMLAGAVIRQGTLVREKPNRELRSPSEGPTVVWRNPDELTPREIEVLSRIAAGDSNQEIADELHVSMATVKTHINHVFTKTGARDRAQAVVYAYDQGLVASPPEG